MKIILSIQNVWNKTVRLCVTRNERKHEKFQESIHNGQNAKDSTDSKYGIYNDSTMSMSWWTQRYYDAKKKQQFNIKRVVLRKCMKWANLGEDGR